MRLWPILLAVGLETACGAPFRALGPSARGERGPRFAYLAQSGGFWQVWVAHEDRGDGQLLTRSRVDKTRISWFPDGDSLLVNTQDGQLVRVQVESGEEEPIPFPMSGMLDAVLSPTGTQIAFSHTTSDSPDANEIWVGDLEGGPARPLTQRARLQHSPAWDPQGAWIYYSSGLGPGRGYDLWRIRPDGTGDQRLSFEGAYRLDVAVAPDGALAYSGNDRGPYDLWLKPASQAPIPLTQDPAADGWPTFSTDGNRLLFESTRSGVLNVWRVSRAGGEAVQVTHHPAPGARMPAYAPTSRGRER